MVITGNMTNIIILAAGGHSSGMTRIVTLYYEKSNQHQIH